MNITVQRYSDNSESTTSLVYINNKFFCYGLEDEARTLKVFGETCIPVGTYKIGLRTTGGHNARYKDRFKFHVGMLHVLDVPNFKYILIHIGNSDDDTAGCLLLGDAVNNNTINDGFISSSTQAYIRFYKYVIDAIINNEEVYITYK